MRSIFEQRKKINSVDVRVKASGYSVLSSTYYSIAGTAGAQWAAISFLRWGFVRLPFFFLAWLPLGGWCWWRMLSLSDRVVEMIGYEGMTAVQCDIRQSILRRRGCLDEASTCIRVGLAKEPRDAHTRGLLYCGFAEIFRKEGDQPATERYVLLALEIVKEAERTDPRQAVRIYRQCAPLADWIHMVSPFTPFITGAELRQKAEELARQTGAKDQILKLG